MLYARPIEERTTGQVSSFDAPLSRYLGASFSQGLHDSVFRSLGRIAEMHLSSGDSTLFGLVSLDNGPLLNPDEAAKRANEQGFSIEFSHPVYEKEYELILERKRAEMQRMFYLQNGEMNAGKFAAGFITQAFASLINPIDFALLFVPVVGQAGKAEKLALTGAGTFSTKIARGLITEEALEASVAFPRLAGSVIEGATGNALSEIPLFISNTQDATLYGPSDSAFNVIAGGAFAGAFRAGLDGASRILSKVNAKTQEAMYRRAIDQFAKGEPIAVHHYVEIDENLLQQQSRFDEIDARMRAKSSAGEIDDYMAQAREQAKALKVPLALNPTTKEPLVLFHATPADNYESIISKGFNPGSHFGTAKAAFDISVMKGLRLDFFSPNHGLKMFGSLPISKIDAPVSYNFANFAGDYPTKEKLPKWTIFPVSIKEGHFLQLTDDEAQSIESVLQRLRVNLLQGINEEKLSFLFENQKPGISRLDIAQEIYNIFAAYNMSVNSDYDILTKQAFAFFDKYKISGVVYENMFEDQGSLSYFIPDPSKVVKLGIDQDFSIDEKSIRKRARQLRENAIKRFVNAEKKLYDPAKKFKELLHQEIKRQQAEGKILSDELIARYSLGESLIEAESGIIEADIKALETQLDIENGVLDDVERALLRESYKPQKETITAAVDCIIKNG